MIFRCNNIKDGRLKVAAILQQFRNRFVILQCSIKLSCNMSATFLSGDVSISPHNSTLSPAEELRNCVRNWNSRVSLANFREEPSFGREQRIFAPRSRRRFAFLRARTRKGDRGPGAGSEGAGSGTQEEEIEPRSRMADRRRIEN